MAEEFGDFADDTKRHARKVQSRSIALSARIEAYLKVLARKLIKDMIEEIKAHGPNFKIEKADEPWDEEKLLRLISLYGLRQANDSGKEFSPDKWEIQPSFVSDYLESKRILIQRIREGFEKDFRESVARAMSEWSKESPQLTMGAVSQRLRTWLTVSTMDDAPTRLQPLGSKFTVGGLGSRARTIARTEINGARNVARMEAGRLTGNTHKIWLAYTDGKSGDRHHEALNKQVRGLGELFENPITGARLMYPGDQNARSKFGVAGEIIRCRCSVRPISQRQAQRLMNR